MDMRRVSGPKEGDPAAFGAVGWTLANTGAAAWAEGTSLRLVCGPPICPTVVVLPAAAPGQTVDISLDCEEVPVLTQLCYVIVDSNGVSFGEWLHATIAPKPEPLPAALVLTSPVDADGGVLGSMQHQIIRAEFTVVNAGQSVWPEDTALALIYNSHGGFKNVPGWVEVPQGVQPKQTVLVSLGLEMAERTGLVTAMWALHSPSVPDFGDVLVVNVNVDDFPCLPPAHDDNDDAASSVPSSWILAEGEDAEFASSTAGDSAEEDNSVDEQDTLGSEGFLSAEDEEVAVARQEVLDAVAGYRQSSGFGEVGADRFKPSARVRAASGAKSEEAAKPDERAVTQEVSEASDSEWVVTEGEVELRACDPELGRPI